MNGPLKTESDPVLGPALKSGDFATIKDVFIGMLNNPEMRQARIKTATEELVKHENSFSHYAEFWLLAALGTEIGHPYHVYEGKPLAYRRKARKCADMSSSLELEYIELSIKCHEHRAKRSHAQQNHITESRYRVALDHAINRRDKLHAWISPS